jgi:molybdenum cofactor synthesis domain-containing protein
MDAMSSKDLDRPVIRFGVLTISDRSSAGQRSDLSGPAIQDFVLREGHQVVKTGIVPDEITQITETLTGWCDTGEVDVVLTTGGTGFSPRDITPEATLAVLERQAPGIAEALRASSLIVTPHAMLSRGVAGIRRHTLIVNMPGSPKAIAENLVVLFPILPHAVHLLQGDDQAETGHQNNRIG